MIRANVGLGANLGDPVATIRAARDRIAERAGRIVAVSSLYRTPPWGELDQPAFINAALALETGHAPHELLAVLKAIEAELGRETTYRWGPRVIDLDILTYGDRRLDTPELTVPHARLLERAFVLVPLGEIDPAFAAARDAFPDDERRAVERIGPFEREGALQ